MLKGALRSHWTSRHCRRQQDARAALGVVGFIITANPVGLIVGSGVKAYGEASGRTKVEGRARATSKAIAEQLKPQFEQEGWIQP